MYLPVPDIDKHIMLVTNRDHQFLIGWEFLENGEEVKGRDVRNQNKRQVKIYGVLEPGLSTGERGTESYLDTFFPIPGLGYLLNSEPQYPLGPHQYTPVHCISIVLYRV